MPNYCSNSVQFLGNPAAVAAVRQLFTEIQQKQSRTNRYHLPDFVSGGTGFMQDIEPAKDWIHYESRWAPNLDLLEQIARRYELGFIAHYKEPMSGLKGTAVFTENTLRYFNFDHEQDTVDEQQRLVEILALQEALLERHSLQR